MVLYHQAGIAYPEATVLAAMSVSIFIFIFIFYYYYCYYKRSVVDYIGFDEFVRALMFSHSDYDSNGLLKL